MRSNLQLYIRDWSICTQAQNQNNPVSLCTNSSINIHRFLQQWQGWVVYPWSCYVVSHRVILKSAASLRPYGLLCTWCMHNATLTGNTHHTSPHACSYITHMQAKPCAAYDSILGINNMDHIFVQQSLGPGVAWAALSLSDWSWGWHCLLSLYIPIDKLFCASCQQ